MPGPVSLDLLPPTAPSRRRSRWAGLAADSLFLLGLAGIAVVVGLGLNRLRAHGLPPVYESRSARLQQSVSRLAVAAPSASFHLPPERIDLARFHDFLGAKHAIILDARPPLFYRAGHVPGARSLARETFESDYARQRPFLEFHRHDSLVVYCAGGDCVDSNLVAAALQKLGYTHILVFEGGWEEWQQAGQPEERG